MSKQFLNEWGLLVHPDVEGDDALKDDKVAALRDTPKSAVAGHTEATEGGSGSRWRFFPAWCDGSTRARGSAPELSNFRDPIGLPTWKHSSVKACSSGAAVPQHASVENDPIEDFSDHDVDFIECSPLEAVRAGKKRTRTRVTLGKGSGMASSCKKGCHVLGVRQRQ